jgi:hypothetical protein
MTDRISPINPPRHADTGELCMRATMTGNCLENHEYHGKPLTPGEARWLYVEEMLEELVRLEPDSGFEEAGDAYEVDEVHRNDDGLIVTVFGTRSTWSDHAVPYLVDNHPYILGDV